MMQKKHLNKQGAFEFLVVTDIQFFLPMFFLASTRKFLLYREGFKGKSVACHGV